MNNLIERWENRLTNYVGTGPSMALAASELKMCLSEIKQALQVSDYPPASLDSMCHFKKHKGKSWKEVIEASPDYADWCLANVPGFQLDEFAHNYLVEVQNTNDNHLKKFV